jgi:hypothetical protein
MRIFNDGWSARAAVAAALIFTGCANAPETKKPAFTLIADSLGDIPMHPDALKLDNLALAHDGSLATRWTSVGNLEPGFFLEVDFPRPRKVAGVVLDASPSPNDHPREFSVETADDAGNWSEAGVFGEDATRGGVTTIQFQPPREVRRILITASKAAPFWWSIYELRVKYAE